MNRVGAPTIYWLFTGDEFEWIAPSGGGEQGFTPGYYRFKQSFGVNQEYAGNPAGPLTGYDHWRELGLPAPSVPVGYGEQAENPAPNWELYELMRARGWRLGSIPILDGRATVRNVYEWDGIEWAPIGKPMVYVENDLVFSVVTGLLITVATAGAAAQVGAAIVGAELAASYPILAQTMGNIAINTLASGGNVERAVQSSLTGLAAGYAGGGVASALDSAAAGKVAAVAAGAAIRGTSVQDALLQSGAATLVKGGAEMFADAWSGEPAIDYEYGVDEGIVPIMEPLNPVAYNMPEGGAFPDTGQVDYVFGGTIQTGFDAAGMDSFPDLGQVADTAPITVADDGNPSGFGASALDFLTNAALAVVKVNAAYQATQTKPPVRINTNPAGGAPVPTAAGMLVTRNPLTGVVQTARPAPGTPYALGDGTGRVIINNGDGTFDLITANGARQRISYSAGSSDPVNWGTIAMIAGGGLLALKLLK